MNREDMIGMRVFFDPRCFVEGAGKNISGRKGTVVGFDDKNHGWPMVEIDLKKRERKKKTVAAPVIWLLELTPHNEKVLDDWLAKKETEK